MRHVAFVVLLTACASDPSPDPMNNPPPESSEPTPAISERRATELVLSWQSDDAHFLLAYAQGDAPAACTSGTVIDLHALDATVSGLAPKTTYGFRLCNVIESADGMTISNG